MFDKQTPAYTPFLKHNDIAKNQDAIMKAGVMDGLVAMLSSPSDIIKMNALASIATLCQDKRMPSLREKLYTLILMTKPNHSMESEHSAETQRNNSDGGTAPIRQRWHSGPLRRCTRRSIASQ